MKSRRGPSGAVVGGMFACFVAGGIAGWWLHSGPPEPAIAAATIGPAAADSAAPPAAQGDRKTATASSPGSARTDSARIDGAVATRGISGTVNELRNRGLRFPIDGVDVESLKGGFGERRDSGGRPHEAVDVLAPRNTPVHAVENGTIAKLFVSKAGGNTIYQYDPQGEICYYYAHLERYADGLSEGSKVARGDVIGFVGTSGNAPANTPHLHFTVFELTGDRRWWQGTPIDPYLVFAHPPAGR